MAEEGKTTSTTTAAAAETKAESAPPPETTWDEAQYESALAHLDQLQNQLSTLRTTIPRLISPLAKPAPTRTQLFRAMRANAVQANGDLAALREQWTADQTQREFARARESVERDADLSKAGAVGRFGWGER